MIENECYGLRELLSAAEVTSINELVKKEYPNWMLCDQRLLYPFLFKAQIDNYLSVVTSPEAASFLVPARIIYECEVVNAGQMHLHFFKFADAKLVKLSYESPHKPREVVALEWINNWSDFKEVLPILISEVQQKLNCRGIRLLSRHVDLDPSYFKTFRFYTPYHIYYRENGENLDYYGNLKSDSTLNTDSFIKLIEELKTELVTRFQGKNLYSAEAVCFVSEQLEAELMKIDLDKINYPFILEGDKQPALMQCQ